LRVADPTHIIASGLLKRGGVRGVEAIKDTFRENNYSVVLLHRHTLTNGGEEDRSDIFWRWIEARELLRNEGRGSAGGESDTEREEPSLTTHRGREEPTTTRLRVLTKGLYNLGSGVQRGFKAKARMFVWKDKVVVDRFWNVNNGDIVVALGELVREIRRSFSTDNDQLIYVVLTEPLHELFDVFLIFEGVEAGCSEDGSSLVVNVSGVIRRKVDDRSGLAHREVSEPVYETLHREATIVGLNHA